MDFKKCVDMYKKHMEQKITSIKCNAKAVCDEIIKQVKEQIEERCKITYYPPGFDCFLIVLRDDLANIACDYHVKKCVTEILLNNYGIKWDEGGVPVSGDNNLDYCHRFSFQVEIASMYA